MCAHIPMSVQEICINKTLPSSNPPVRGPFSEKTSFWHHSKTQKCVWIGKFFKTKKTVFIDILVMFDSAILNNYRPFIVWWNKCQWREDELQESKYESSSSRGKTNVSGGKHVSARLENVTGEERVNFSNPLRFSLISRWSIYETFLVDGAKFSW